MVCVCACVCACVRACVRARVRVCVRACVPACVCTYMLLYATNPHVSAQLGSVATTDRVHECVRCLLNSWQDQEEIRREVYFLPSGWHTASNQEGSRP